MRYYVRLLFNFGSSHPDARVVLVLMTFVLQTLAFVPGHAMQHLVRALRAS